MQLIVNDLVTILKSELDGIEKEIALSAYLKERICTFVAQALEIVDESLIKSQKEQGYQIEKKSKRTMVTTIGEIPVTRRRYVSDEGPAIYPLDAYMGWGKYNRYSTLLVRNLGELATRMTYRSAEKAIERLAPFTMSHQKVNLLVNQAGKNLKKQQTADQRYDALEKPKTAPKVLYIEGDGFLVKSRNNKHLEVHRFQLCEGFREEGKGRNRKVREQARDFVSLDRKTAMKEMMDYMGNTYHLQNTVVISNGDGGSGYTKDVFDELCGNAARHEFFLDGYHVNRKIKERLCFVPELQGKLMQAVWRDYNKEAVACILDTAESLLLDGLDTFANQEHLRKLKNYLERNWAHLKPFGLRKLGSIPKVIGACESNHRLYTYRMKGQGKYWTESGAEAIVRLIASLKNQDLDRWLVTDFKESIAVDEIEKRVRSAVRTATSKRWNKVEASVGIHAVRIVGSEKSSTGMGKLAKAWSN